ncbi:MAG: Mur ligase family protein [Bacteriovorax sp.]|jgi:UDP-N-acetylmuramate: L-alanyl-gamma-D-glutamyl-meso-diaminopimelate ligase
MNLTHKQDFNGLKKYKKDIKKVFFYRVCGTGMGAAACLLKEKGYDVQGGDSNFYPPMSTYLESTGISLFKLDQITPDFLKSFDLIVVGNVIPNGGPDARLIEELGVKFSSFPTAIGALVLSDVNVIGIAGTHGKTTTTFLATQIFEKLGANPGYLIGGVMEERPSSRLGSGKYFFIESDEYDSAYFEKISKFRSYSLDNLILTSLEFDHADIFNSVEDIKAQFRAAIPHISKTIIMSADYIASIELFNEFSDDDKERWLKYGEKSEAGPQILHTSETGTRFQIRYKKEDIVFETNLIGRHNIMNVTAVILYALTEGFSAEEIAGTLKDLHMVKRRQEVRGSYKGALIIDDFAHHPRAVELTLDGIITQYPKRKVHVIMEPNSATARSAIFQKEFTDSLSKAASVIFTKPTRPTSVKNVGDLDIYKIIDAVKASGRPGSVVGNLVELREEIEKIASPENLILILSNGTCLGLWESEFVKNLTQ